MIHDHDMLQQCKTERTVSGGNNGDHTLFKVVSDEKLKQTIEEACMAMKGFKGSVTLEGVLYDIDCNRR